MCASWSDILNIESETVERAEFNLILYNVVYLYSAKSHG